MTAKPGTCRSGSPGPWADPGRPNRCGRFAMSPPTPSAAPKTVSKVTGPAATMSDQIVAADHDLLFISVATVALIAAILLLVYRSVFTALLPLLVIGLSLAVGRGILAALGEVGMPVSQFTIAFMTVILLGAGTDYSVFLISRYHEQRRQGVAVDQAVVHATATIGRVILASAATVALALLSMAFATLNIFATSGPACAIAVLVGFVATVTLLPPVLVVAARRGIGEPRADRTRAYWNRIAVTVVRKPVPLLVVSLVVLLALAAVCLTMRISYDDRKGQPATTASNEGYRLLDRHFPKDMTMSDFLLVESPKDMRTGTGLADLEELASRVSQIAGVTKVVGVTRPTGQAPGTGRISLAERTNRRQARRRGPRRRRPQRSTLAADRRCGSVGRRTDPTRYQRTDGVGPDDGFAGSAAGSGRAGRRLSGGAASS